MFNKKPKSEWSESDFDVQKLWNDYKENFVSEDATPEEVNQLKQAFFAGLFSYMKSTFWLGQMVRDGKMAIVERYTRNMNNSIDAYWIEHIKETLTNLDPLNLSKTLKTFGL